MPSGCRILAFTRSSKNMRRSEQRGRRRSSSISRVSLLKSITFGETRGAYAALAPNATGDPRNRPGKLRTQYIQGVYVVVGKKDFQVAFRICGSSNAEQRLTVACF